MGKRKTAISGQLADLDLRLLRVFKSVADCGGFTAAEVELNLANSTISNYIADLEKRLDMRLCERGRAGFSLTEQGKVVYEATQELLAALDQFRNRVNHSHDRILGHLHLGCAEHMLGLPRAFIVQALGRFADRAPEVRMRISTMASDDVVPAVLDGRVQLGITVLPYEVPGLRSLKLYDEQMSLYCGRGHPLHGIPDSEIRLEDLQRYNFVESPRLQPGRELHPSMAAWNKQVSAHHQEARATLILTGRYLGFLPRHLVRNWGWGDELQPILKQQLSYSNTFCAITKPKAERNIVVDAFVQCLRDALADEVKAL
ncbi:LysR family transcriptional regulator [Marinobacterium nitratireducens]|uniref:LysR family transcriptional regulator n=1 Tax=Marinobacterium nitratireducens TaxID=518897 RepID=A0A917ZIP0_9GAMM|nr:LysR family transcriptional regulator [Marinobacterium nitratireducens]GGO83498.1 LysR family transcriptional regulator [Marinobacterium nitratireducens]